MGTRALEDATRVAAASKAFLDAKTLEFVGHAHMRNSKGMDAIRAECHTLLDQHLDSLASISRLAVR